MNKLFECIGVDFSYSKIQILKKLNLEIYQGDFIALIGPNGSGKSTLVKLMIQELKPNVGKLHWFLSQDNLSEIGYIPQNIQFLRQIPANVEEVVGISIYKDKNKKQKIKDVLKKVQYNGSLKQLVSNLSGGQLQKVALAKILVANPKVLILDEPTSGIDQEGVTSLYQILDNLHKQGLTIITVTHGIANMIDIVNRIVCIEEGNAMALDKKVAYEELKHRHQHPHDL